MSDNADPILEFKDVNLKFGETWGLQELSLVLHPGNTFIVFGAAGSGKTTLLKAVIGLVAVDSGQIDLFGQDVTRMSEHDFFALRARVGILFQEGGLFDSLPVGENVEYPLVNQQTGKAHGEKTGDTEKRVREALRFVELEQTYEKFPSELSGGMRRRVGIARAIVTNPPLVLYDSPTAGLDPITANTIMALIAKERDSLNAANLIVTQRYQDGQLMANFRYNRKNGHLEPVPKNGGADQAGSNPTHTIFMVMKEGRLIFEGTQARLEASTDAYISKFVPQHHN